jgi:hypothetical protein
VFFVKISPHLDEDSGAQKQQAIRWWIEIGSVTFHHPSKPNGNEIYFGCHPYP